MDVSSVGRFVAARLHAAAAPLILEYELTHLCNLACHYCDRHTRQADELSREEIFRILDEFFVLGMRAIGLDGGEPLTHPQFSEIVDWLVERDVIVHLNTNGLLVPRKLEHVRKVKQLKVSLDGPPRRNDAMRGRGAFERALKGALAAREASVAVELRCVVGVHNWDGIDELLDLVETLDAGLKVMFQPARESLFAGNARDSSRWAPGQARMAAAFDRVEARKRAGSPVANRWGSLAHFRHFPGDLELPCAAGWIKATMDPGGRLYHCGMLKRDPEAPSARTLGAKAAFAALPRHGCGQCWCGRAVEGNLAWGGRLIQLGRPLRARGRGVGPANGAVNRARTHRSSALPPTRSR
ncbi:MAG: radical SAM protein [Myxococcales bacterium]|nr:radical SAM protein [Myxococcales bacterium]